MMQARPHQQKVLKGSLVALDPSDQKAKVTIPFQYNPAEVKRHFSSIGDTRLTVALSPVQSLDMTIQLESMVSGATSGSQRFGLMPSLAALELLMWPKSQELDTYLKKLDSATLWAAEPSLPQVLLVWGPRRVLPVRITSLAMTEGHFNTELSPRQAEVSLSLEVVTFDAESTEEERTHLVSYLRMLEKLDNQAGNKNRG